MSSATEGLVLGALAVWRLTHLLVAEDGPARVVARLREALPADGFAASVLGCFYCLSLWVALPFAGVLAEGWAERGMAWLALSGAACLLERIGPAAPALFHEDGEEKRS